MRRTLTFLACFYLVSSSRGEEPIFPDSGPARNLGGLMIIRQGNETTWSLGGVLFPRRLKVVTATPDGPIVTRFTLPSTFQGPTTVPWWEGTSAYLSVEIPDRDGVLYIEDKLIRGDGYSATT